MPIVVCWPIAMYEMQHTILFRMATFDTGVELLTLDGNVKRVPHFHRSSFFFYLHLFLSLSLSLSFPSVFIFNSYPCFSFHLLCFFVSFWFVLGFFCCVFAVRFELLAHTQLSDDRRNSAHTHTTCYCK